MHKFIRVKTGIGHSVDINVSHIETVQYNAADNCTVFTTKQSRMVLTTKGDWSRKFTSFLQSGAVWTDGERLEYAK